MMRESFEIGRTRCEAYGCPSPRILLIQPIDLRDAEDRTAAIVAQRSDVPFLHVSFTVTDWNRELSPWEAPPVFGKEPFGCGARQTLAVLESELLPQVFARFSLDSDTPVVLGGYSLAALFALWAVYESDRFAGAVCASPSVWFPGWLDYAKARSPKAKHIYLSLGDREERAKNPVLASVGDCIRTQADLLRSDPSVQSMLEWNAGNHFCEPDLRCAKGFLRWMAQD